MITRLLAKLQPKRRHLTFLVGLLVLTFVLTAALAYRAHRSDVGLQRVAEQRLTDTASRAAAVWSENLQTLSVSELAGFAARVGATLVELPDQGLTELARSVPMKFCRRCADQRQVEGFFSVDAGRAITRLELPIPDVVLMQVWEEIENGNFSRVHPALGIGIHFVADTERVYPIAAITVIGPDNTAIRAYGFALTEQAARDMLEFAFLTMPPPVLLAGSIPNDSIFSFTATVFGTSLLASSTDVPLPGRQHMTQAPMTGLELAVGVLPSARDLIVVPTSSAASVALLVGLLALIGGLIVLALLLVRKEAELVQLRADFVSSVSHELRTPLAQIRMFTETLLLGRVRTDLERRRSLEIIDQEAHRLTHLVENVLLFSSSEGGREPRLKPEPTPFAVEVRQAIETFGPFCRMRGVEIRAELQENIAAQVDRGALRQILVNLIDNALKYGPAGQRITVGAALFGDAARLWVDDEGPGVRPVDRERIFESFFRMQRDVESHSTGSGIGLAVVRELARLHGGSAWVETAPGTGARFLIELPDAFLRTEPTAAGLAAAS